MSGRRGAFILFEGVDRCGKSTQVARLTQRLQDKGVAAVQMRFPDRTSAIGTMIDKYLRSEAELDDRAVHLLFAANRWEARATMLQHLREGRTVVCDRYAYSGVAFTAAKGFALDWCKAPDAGLPAPDVVIYLQMPVAAAMQRGGAGDERYEKADFQRRVKRIFEEELFDTATWRTVNAAQSIEEVTAAVAAIADDAVARAVDAPTGTIFESQAQQQGHAAEEKAAPVDADKENANKRVRSE